MSSILSSLPRTGVLTLLATAIASMPAIAQDAPYPSQNVTLIVSAAPGGTTDLAARMISDPLSKALGKLLKSFK